jgi:IS30 family transposase
MANHYQQLTSAERATIMAMLAEGVAQSQIARDLGRSRSTISRELARNGSAADLETGARKLYDAMAAQVRRGEETRGGLRPSRCHPPKDQSRPLARADRWRVESAASR